MNKAYRFTIAAVALLLGFIIALRVGTTHGLLAGFFTYAVADLAVLHLVATPGTLYANSLGTLSTGLILTSALSQAVKLRPALSRVCLDWSSEPAKKDDVVRSRVIGAATVNDFGTGAADRTDTDVSVTLSGFKEAHFKFTGAQIAATSRNLVEESAKPIAEALADHWMAQLGALWASLTYTNDTVIASASFGYTTLTGIRQELNAPTRAVPKSGRFGVVNSDVYNSLLEDPLCNRSTRGDGADPTATGELVGIAGFEAIYEYPGLPSTNNTNGFFGHKESAVLMVRPPNNPLDMFPGIPADGNIAAVSIPDPNDPGKPGLTVIAIEKISALDLSVDVKVCWLQGAAVARVAFGERTKTA